MNEGDQVDPVARAEAMRRAATTTPADKRAPGWNVADKIHSLLPDWISARAAIMRKRAQLRDLDAATAEEPRGQP